VIQEGGVANVMCPLEGDGRLSKSVIYEWVQEKVGGRKPLYFNTT